MERLSNDMRDRSDGLRRTGGLSDAGLTHDAYRRVLPKEAAQTRRLLVANYPIHDVSVSAR
jgi:hypothetical protein